LKAEEEIRKKIEDEKRRQEENEGKLREEAMRMKRENESVNTLMSQMIEEESENFGKRKTDDD
jgi:hypothetical protein